MSDYDYPSIIKCVECGSYFYTDDPEYEKCGLCSRNSFICPRCKKEYPKNMMVGNRGRCRFCETYGDFTYPQANMIWGGMEK